MPKDDDDVKDFDKAEDSDPDDEHLLHKAAEKQHPVEDNPDDNLSAIDQEKEPSVHDFEDLSDESSSFNRSGSNSVEDYSSSPHQAHHPPGVEPGRPKTFGLDREGSLMTDQIPSSGVYTSRNQPRARSSKLKTIILLLIALAVTAGSVYVLKHKVLISQFVSQSPSPSPSVEVLASEAPTATPLPSITRSDFKLRVLNGTPKTGLAGSTADKLKGLGYNIDRTGNATNSAFTQTTILVKSSDQDLLTVLTSDLGPDFTATGSATLKASDPDDGEVILGTK